MSHERPKLPPMPEWPEPAVTGLAEITGEPIVFTPVPRLRNRRNGWTPEAQRAFIDALEQYGCVARAARAAGMAPRSAYRLLGAEGADSFAEAWDQAIARGVERVRGEAMDRALRGAWVPVVRRGKVVRMEHRFHDRLAIALLSGRESSVATRRERAVSRRQYRLMLAERDRLEDEKQRQEEEIRALHQQVLDRIEAERANPPPSPPPRIRRL